MLRNLACVSSLFFASSATASFPAVTGTSVCSAGTALAKNLAVTVSTDTPAKGEVVYTTFDFDLDAPITDGVAYYDATLNGFPYSAQSPLCDETQKSGDPCPLLAGHHHQVSNATSTVSGKLVTKITWRDINDLEILCAQITTKTA